MMSNSGMPSRPAQGHTVGHGDVDTAQKGDLVCPALPCPEHSPDAEFLRPDAPSSTLGQITLPCGAALCPAGCLQHLRPLECLPTPLSLPCDNQKYLQTLPKEPWGLHHPADPMCTLTPSEPLSLGRKRQALVQPVPDRLGALRDKGPVSSTHPPPPPGQAQPGSISP